MDTQNVPQSARHLQGRLPLIAASTGLLLLPSMLPAQSLWNGGGADANWSTAANWDLALANSFSSALSFGGSTRLTNHNDLAGGTATSLTFNAGAGAFTLGGNALTLGGNITNSSTNLQTINTALATTAVRTVTLTTGGGNVAIGGNITGTGGGITTAGAGTLTLSGDNAYTGATSIGAGTTIQVGSATALGASTGSLTIASGATLDLNGTSVSKGTLTANTASATVTSTAAASLGILYNNTTNALSGLRVNGAASLVIGGAGTNQAFGNNTIINGTGAIVLKGNTGNVRLNNLPTNLGSSGTLTFDGTGLLQNSARIDLPSTASVRINGTGNVWDYQQSGTNATGATVNGAVTGSGTITTRQGFNAWLVMAGDMSAFSGTWNFQNSGTTTNNSTQLRFTNTSANVAGSANAAFTQSAFSSGNTGTNIISWQGTGDRTIALGDLTTTFAGGFTPGGGAFLQNGTTGTTATFKVGALGLSSDYNGVIRNNGGTGGTVALTKVGSGTWTLSGANSYTGTTRIEAGTLALGANNVFAVTNFELAGGKLDVGTFTNTTVGTLTLATGTASTISLGVGSQFLFADSSLINWGTGTVSILGTFVDGQSIRFGTTDAGLTPTQLSSITINSAPAYITSLGYLTTVPEPSTWAAIIGSLALGVAVLRRRR